MGPAPFALLAVVYRSSRQHENVEEICAENRSTISPTQEEMMPLRLVRRRAMITVQAIHMRADCNQGDDDVGDGDGRDGLDNPGAQ
ncbi:hypothetical protein CFRS1_v002121 [Colletotrichum fructicola]|nr:hypothetical protein CFRS1_v002121 [Colletotrichum fructicola]